MCHTWPLDLVYFLTFWTGIGPLENRGLSNLKNDKASLDTGKVKVSLLCNSVEHVCCTVVTLKATEKVTANEHGTVSSYSSSTQATVLLRSFRIEQVDVSCMQF